jgi:Domain of unknown function (DUF5668)/Putative adhesin
VRINTGLVFWGVALITAGVVALAIQAGAIAEEPARQVWRFWPVIIIVIGLAVIAARTPLATIATVIAALVVGGMGGTLVAGFPEGFGFGCDGDRADEMIAEEGSFGTDAKLALDINCGQLSVTTAAGSDWSVEARHAGDAPRIEVDAESVRVESPDGFAFFGGGDAMQAWEVTLPTDATLDVSVDANASSSRLDLAGASLSRLSMDSNAGDVTMAMADASVTQLEVDSNAGSVSIEVGDDTELTGSISVNAGSVELCVRSAGQQPGAVGLAINLADTNVTFSHNLDEAGLTQDGDTWRTGDGDPAITLDVSGNAASFTLNPDGGCT